MFANIDRCCLMQPATRVFIAWSQLTRQGQAFALMIHYEIRIPSRVSLPTRPMRDPSLDQTPGGHAYSKPSSHRLEEGPVGQRQASAELRSPLRREPVALPQGLQDGAHSRQSLPGLAALLTAGANNDMCLRGNPADQRWFG